MDRQMYGRRNGQTAASANGSTLVAGGIKPVYARIIHKGPHSQLHATLCS